MLDHAVVMPLVNTYLKRRNVCGAVVATQTVSLVPGQRQSLSRCAPQGKATHRGPGRWARPGWLSRTLREDDLVRRGGRGEGVTAMAISKSGTMIEMTNTAASPSMLSCLMEKM